MRRSAFIKLNQKRWTEFERLLSNSNPDPDVLADLFIQVTDDLSYSNTQYPDSDTTRYLNALASKIHLTIYKNKKEEKSRFKVFWVTELPLIFYKYRKQLLYSLLIFTISVAIGALSAANDSTFVRLILGDSYVDMTLNNIESGEPMGVYGEQSSGNMFFTITFNNILVSFIAFVWGGFLGSFPMFILLSFGTGIILFRNGVMLGAFQYFFVQHNLFTESFLTVWIHGTIEISSIIIAGAAGIIAGNSILFPGTYSRMTSFKRGFKDGTKILIGLIPMFVIAGFLESYVTRLYDMPNLLKLTIILLSFAGMLWYVVLYPIKINKKNELH